MFALLPRKRARRFGQASLRGLGCPLGGGGVGLCFFPSRPQRPSFRPGFFGPWTGFPPGTIKKMFALLPRKRARRFGQASLRGLGCPLGGGGVGLSFWTPASVLPPQVPRPCYMYGGCSSADAPSSQGCPAGLHGALVADRHRRSRWVPSAALDTFFGDFHRGGVLPGCPTVVFLTVRRRFRAFGEAFNRLVASQPCALPTSARWRPFPQRKTPDPSRMKAALVCDRAVGLARGEIGARRC